jgi:hypothetical protein
VVTVTPAVARPLPTGEKLFLVDDAAVTGDPRNLDPRNVDDAAGDDARNAADSSAASSSAVTAANSSTNVVVLVNGRAAGTSWDRQLLHRRFIAFGLEEYAPSLSWIRVK